MNINRPEKTKRKWIGNAFAILSCVWLLASCGKVEETVNEISNEQRVKGHWLMTESEHAGAIEKALEKESVVLTFKDSNVAFSPVDSVKGKALFATLADCTKNTRPYTIENNTIVLPAKGACPEKRVAIQKLDGSTLKFPDPETPDVTRVFLKIDENKFKELVKESDRRP